MNALIQEQLGFRGVKNISMDRLSAVCKTIMCRRENAILFTELYAQKCHSHSTVILREWSLLLNHHGSIYPRGIFALNF